MKLATPVLAATALICGGLLAHAGDRDSGVTSGNSRLKERSTTGMGTRESVPGRTYSETHQNYPPQPIPRDPYLRADRDNFPASPFRR